MKFLGVSNFAYKLPAILVIILSIYSTFRFAMSIYFYPNLLEYQSESKIGKKIHEMEVPIDRFYLYESYNPCLDFYSRRTVPYVDLESLKNFDKGTLIFTDQSGMSEIIEVQKLNYKIFNTYEDFHVTELNFTFLMKNTRDQEIQNTYLLEKIE